RGPTQGGSRRVFATFSALIIALGVTTRAECIGDRAFRFPSDLSSSLPSAGEDCIFVCNIQNSVLPTPIQTSTQISRPPGQTYPDSRRCRSWQNDRSRLHPS